MAEKPRTSNLRYLDAGHVADDRIDLDGLDVRNASGDKLGSVDGFIVQRDSNRPYYLVVDSGGWFSSRHYLVPIGHVRFDPEDRALRVDIERETINGFPEVHIDRFDDLSEDEARGIDRRTLAVLAPAEVSSREGDTWDYDRWSHYQQPDWWRAQAAGELPPPPLTNRPLAEDYDPTVRATGLPPSPVTGYAPEQITARRDDDLERNDDLVRREPVRRDDLGSRATVDAGRTVEGTPVEDIVDRAQPGDVLGIETGGETTALGDTARDEDERREDAEEANREILRDQRKDERE
jgi:hypothetical protein